MDRFLDAVAEMVLGALLGVVAVLLMAVVPLLVFWAANTIFGTSITLTVGTFFAFWVLVAFLAAVL